MIYLERCHFNNRSVAEYKPSSVMHHSLELRVLVKACLSSLISAEPVSEIIA
jgi:hypothetical protein